MIGLRLVRDVQQSNARRICADTHCPALLLSATAARHLDTGVLQQVGQGLPKAWGCCDVALAPELRAPCCYASMAVPPHVHLREHRVLHQHRKTGVVGMHPTYV